MNDIRLHLLINHLPIIGLFIAIAILIAGLSLKSTPLKKTALVLLIFCAITAVAAHITGERAEELVENLPGIEHDLIHEHEEATEPFKMIMIAVGGLSLIVFFLEVKNNKLALYGYYLILILSFAGMYTGYQSGKTGGEIRRPELRA